MKTQFKRNPQEVREEMANQGLSISRWAANNGVSGNLAAAVLRGERECVRGECHKIAVLLGIKDGVITPPHLRGPIIQAYADTNGLPPKGK